MTNATTTNTTTASTPTTNLVVGQIVTGVVHKALDYGVLVKVGDEMTLLKDDQFSGGTHANRKARRKAAALKTEITVEVVDIKPPAEGDKSNRMRIRVSERTLQDSAVLAALRGCTETEAGSTVEVTVKDVRKDYVLCAIADGAATGYQAILHAVNVPGSTRPQRDQFVADCKVGDAFTAEVLSINPDKDPRRDLNIALTLVAESARTTKAALSDTSKTYKGTAGRQKDGGLEVEFGPSDSPMRGILPNHEVPAATKTGMSVKVRIASVNGDRITLTRKGV
jgi:ribosomal protein S1